MAKLNFPDPAVTQTYSAAGTTWTWNSTLGVWSAIPGDGFTETVADGRYLKLDASNDPVTGTCEFASDLILDSITSAPALGTDADGKIIATSGGGSSQWTDTTGGIYYNGGNVGVGTASPGAKLDVVGGAKIGVSVSADVLDAVSSTTYLKGGTGGVQIQTPNGTNRMGINNNGNVGIGLTTPSEKLHVNGNVKASSFIGNVTGNVSGSSGSCTGNAATATTATNCSRSVLAGNGLSGGGALTANRTLTVQAANNTISVASGGISVNGGNVSAGSATNATNSTNGRIDHDNGNAWHRPVFIDDGKGSGTNQRLKTDSASTIGINPSSHQIRATTFVGALSGNASTASTATNCSRTISASNGLTGGGQLNGNRTISGVNGSTSAKGVVQLSNDINSTSQSLAATINAVNYGYVNSVRKNGSGASGTWGINISGAVNNSNYNVNNTNTGTVRLMFTGSSYPSVPASNGTGSNGWCFNPGGSAFNNYYNTNSAKTSLWLNRQGNSSGKFIQFRYGAGNLSSTGERGNIRLTDSGNKTAYNTTSDYRLKSNVAPMTDGIDEVKRLKPCTWTWTNNAADGVGFIAHELQEVFPSAVCGEKDATVAIGTLRNSSGEIVAEGIENDEEDFCCYLETDTDENGVSTMEAHTWEQTGERDEFQCVDYGLVTPLLTAALKEAIAKIENLEGRLAALEGANE